jgi:uncharacterized membrane protein YdjX (TVP38/TMEM64 family)
MPTEISPLPASPVVPPTGWRAWWKPVLFIVAAVVLAVLFYNFRHDLTFKHLAHRQQVIHDYHAEHPLLTPIIVFGCFVVNVGLYLPLSIALTLLSGWLFGFWGGAVLASFANAGGCLLGMLISRYLLRGAISGYYSAALAQANRLVERDGALYLLSLRLVHVIPSWLINLLLGWTDIRLTTFWWATQLGTLPATLLYAWLGSHFPSLEDMHRADWSAIITLPRVGMFVLLALLPLALKPLLHRKNGANDK